VDRYLDKPIQTSVLKYERKRESDYDTKEKVEEDLKKLRMILKSTKRVERLEIKCKG